MKKNKLVLTGSKSLFIIILSRIYPLILICIIGIIIYSNSFDCSFHFDDFRNISTNKNIHDIHDIYAIWNSGHFKRFVGYYTFALNYHFHQENVFGYHFVNLLIHICSTLLVFWLVLLILSTPGLRKKPISRQKKIIALMCSLLFLTHPVQIQAVTYIYQRLASLATLFYLASLGFYMKARLTKKKHISLISFVISVIMALLGMFTKETVFTLPFAIILFEFSLLSGDTLFNKKKRTVLLYTVLPLLFAIIIFGIYSPNIKWILGPRISSRTQDPPLTFGIYLITQFRVIVTYIRLLFLPINQNLDYDFPASRSFFEPSTLGSFFLLVSIFVIAIRLFPNKRVMSLGIVWFFLTLSIESIIPLHDVIFEYRLYLPMFGFNLFFVSMLHHILWEKHSKVMIILLLLTISCYSFLTYERNKIFKNDFTLWSDVVMKSPNKERPYNNLGNYFFHLGKYKEAGLNFQKALKLNPNFHEAHNDLGSVLFHLGKLDEAILEFKKALNIYPAYSEAHYNLGYVLYYQGKLDEAIVEYQKALNLDPKYIDAHYNLGIIFQNQGKLDEAIVEYQKVIHLDSKYADAHYNLGIVFYSQRKIERAIEQFLKVVSLNPDHVNSHLRLAVCYQMLGKENESKIHSEKAKS
ncbi:tetratricopeptide repeat protein, partial [Candidatus Latescibacterota bacterium]